MTDRILGKYFRVSDPQGLNEDPLLDPDPQFECGSGTINSN